MTIYTKKGDKGETGLPGDKRLSKGELIFEVLGDLDQTNASLGLAISYLTHDNEKPLVVQLQDIQASLLGVGACLASENPSEQIIVKKLPGLTIALEKQIDRWNDQLPELNNFILPGGDSAGAALHLTRTISRRAERSYHRLPEANKVQEVSIYLNRLADYFFQAARFDILFNHCEETTWTN